MVGWQEGHSADKNHVPLISRGSASEQVKGEDLGELANPGKMSIRWK